MVYSPPVAEPSYLEWLLKSPDLIARALPHWVLHLSQERSVQNTPNTQLYPMLTNDKNNSLACLIL